ncbi:MAG: cyclic nucleotide-binding domain-containing protein [Deltaproteobacteria bacterium]|nr:cyclic nucleotide-binding domain-containing protein [Deltaproteobacteria bacterium]
MTIEGLGKLYADGELIVRQGDKGNCMFVIQKGSAEVLLESEEGEVRVATMKQGDTFGEMAIFEREVRSATVRALGEARILTIDKRTFLRRVQEDPTLAFNILRVVCERLRRQTGELVELRHRFAVLKSESAASRDAVEQSDTGPR